MSALRAVVLLTIALVTSASCARTPASDLHGASPLQMAMLHRDRRAFEALLGAGADTTSADDDGATVMQYAAYADDPAYLEILLARRTDPNVRNAITGATPLDGAIMAGHGERARSLLAAGADPNAADLAGDTPLHVAAQVNDFRTVLELLEAGSDPAALNKRATTFQRYLGMTPPSLLLDEARRERASIVAWMHAHDVPVDASLQDAP